MQRATPTVQQVTGLLLRLTRVRKGQELHICTKLEPEDSTLLNAATAQFNIRYNTE
jgi:hypothetical protein